MKAKKSGVFAVLAVTLLITAALIASCVKPVNFDGLSASQQEEPVTQLPEGMGYLKLTIAEEGPARTIMPTNPGAIDYYIVVGTPATTDDDGDPITPSGSTFNGNFTSTSGSIVAAVGVYSVEVTAFKEDPEDPGTFLAVARGTSATNAAVTSGGTNTSAVTLKGIINGATTQGTFKWNLTLPTTPVTLGPSTITLTNYPSGTAVGAVTNTTLLGGGNNNTGSAGILLNSGYYYVTVTLSANGYATFTKTDLVHIYGNLTTTYTNALFAGPTALAVNEYDVTYHYVAGVGVGTPVVDDNSTNHYTHGTLINNFYSTPPTNTTPGETGYTVEGWYKNSGLTGNKWNFASDIILRPTDLYAKWQAPISITVSIGALDTGDKTFSLSASPSSISQATLETTPTVVVTLTDGANAWTVTEWRKGGAVITDGDPNDKTLTLTFTSVGNAGTPPPVNSTIPITVFAKNASNETYSGTITLVIGN